MQTAKCYLFSAYCPRQPPAYYNAILKEEWPIQLCKSNFKEILGQRYLRALLGLLGNLLKSYSNIVPNQDTHYKTTKQDL